MAKTYKTLDELRERSTELQTAYSVMRDALDGNFLTEAALVDLDALDWIDCDLNPADRDPTMDSVAEGISNTIDWLLDREHTLSGSFDMKVAREMNRWARHNLSPKVRNGHPQLQSGYQRLYR